MKKKAGRRVSTRAMAPSTHARLYQEHYPRIRSYFVQKLGGGQEADDLAQQVFKELAEAPTPEDPGTYLGAIARNLLSEHLHRREKELAALRELCRVCSAHHSGAPSAPRESELSELECEDILKDIAGMLGPKRMELLRLRFFDDLSIEEIASRLACSEQAVHKRLQRVIKCLRQRYRVDE